MKEVTVENMFIFSSLKQNNALSYFSNLKGDFTLG